MGDPSPKILLRSWFSVRNCARAVCRHRTRRVVAAERARPRAEHLCHGSHRIGGRDALVIGRPVITNQLPPFLRLLPMDAARRVQVFPRLRRHHDGAGIAHRLEQRLDHRLRAAAHISKRAKRAMDHNRLPRAHANGRKGIEDILLEYDLSVHCRSPFL